MNKPANLALPALLTLLGLSTQIVFADPWQVQYINPPASPYQDWIGKQQTGLDSGAIWRCIEFDSFESETQYGPGDEITLQHGAVRFKTYLRNAQPPATGVQFAELRQSRIANGDPRELRVVRVLPVFKMNRDLHKITVRFAENIGGAGVHANLVVNGERIEVSGSLATADEIDLGDAHVRVWMDETPPAGSWRRGIMEIHAEPGDLEHWGLGGNPLMLDNICLYE